MASTVKLPATKRIEGHGRVSLYLDDAGRVHDAHFDVTEFRGFESMLEGRMIWEMPLVTSRICGVCPVSHHLAAVKAADALLGAEDPASRADASRSAAPGRLCPGPRAALLLPRRAGLPSRRRRGRARSARCDRCGARARPSRHRASPSRTADRRDRRGALEPPGHRHPRRHEPRHHRRAARRAPAARGRDPRRRDTVGGTRPRGDRAAARAAPGVLGGAGELPRADERGRLRSLRRRRPGDGAERRDRRGVAGRRLRLAHRRAAAREQLRERALPHGARSRGRHLPRRTARAAQPRRHDAGTSLTGAARPVSRHARPARARRARVPLGADDRARGGSGAPCGAALPTTRSSRRTCGSRSNGSRVPASPRSRHPGVR